MKKVAFYTLGCKLNFSETSTLARQLQQQGHERVAFTERPDVFVINTCSVTDHADRKCRKVVREARRINPDAFVAIVGCYAQLKPQEIADITGVDAVLGAAEKFRLAELLGDFTRPASGRAAVFHSPVSEALEYHAGYSLNDRTRTFLKVQDGCDYPCSYCTIPLARGASRSDRIDRVLAAATDIAARGVQEIILTGVNIGDFGLQNGQRQETLFELLQALEALDLPVRYRISSIEPNLLTDEMIAFVAASKHFVPHFHLPLQSGSNTVLGLMKRRYRRELYAGRVAYIKALMPGACIGVDVMVGHPGETPECFAETHDFLQHLPVSYFHVFTYSERPGTHALTLGPIVPQALRAERSQVLHLLSDKKRRAFYESQAGTRQRVLFEDEHEGHFMLGYTPNYVRVRVPYDPLLIHEMKTMQLLGIGADGLMEAEEAGEYVPA